MKYHAPVTQPAFAVTLAAALAGYAALLQRVRSEQSSSRFASYSRDAVNLLGTVALVFAHRMLGWSGPTALFGGLTLTLIVYLLDWLTAVVIRTRAARIAFYCALAGWLAFASLAPPQAERPFAWCLQHY
jgi:hypothetical protein